MPNLFAQTLKSTIFTYVGIAIGFVTQGIFFPVIFSKEQIGLLTLLVSLSHILAHASNLGLNNAGGKYFPYFRNVANNHNGYLYITIVGTSIGFGLICLVLTGTYTYTVDYYRKHSLLFVEYYYFLIPLTLFTVSFTIIDNYSRLLYDPVTGTILQQFFQRVLILISGTLFWYKLVNFYEFMLLWLISFLLPTICLVVLIISKNKLAIKKPQQFSLILKKDFVRYAIMTLASGLSTQIITVVDKAMLSSAANLSQTGIYSVALNFATVIAVPATALYKVASINIAEAWKKDDLEIIRVLYKKSCMNQLIAGSFVYICIITNLHIIYSYLPKGYDTGYYALILLGLAKLIDMATGINGIILYTSRYYIYDTVFFVIMILVTIGINNLLIPPYGINGAALGALLVTFLYNITRTIFIIFAFKMQPFDKKNLLVIVISFITWYIIHFISNGKNDSKIISFFNVIINSSATLIIYLSLILLTNVSYDINKLFFLTISKFRERLCNFL